MSTAKFGADIPFVKLMGFDLTVFDGGEAEIHYTPKAEHLNSFGVAHGGVIMALLDTTMATAARSVQKDMGAVTIEMKTSFMRPAAGALVARGKLLHRSSTLAFVEGSVFDAQERICAHATGTFKYARALATGGKATLAFQAVSTD